MRITSIESIVVTATRSVTSDQLILQKAIINIQNYLLRLTDNRS